MSLRLRLALGIALVVALSLGLLGIAVVQTTRNDLQTAIRVQVQQSLANRVNAARPPLQSQPGSDPRVLATAHFAFTATNEQIVAEPAGPPSDPTPLPVLTWSDVVTLRTGRSVTAYSADRSVRYLVLGSETRNGRIEVEAAPLSVVDNTISSLIQRFALGALVTLLLAAGAVALVLRNGLRPLRNVIETADAVAAGERDQRIPTDEGPSEIRHLSSALDRMLQQQRAALIAKEHSEARFRRFIADASHELQTPITSVLGWTELQRKGALDEAGTVAALARVESESRRMAVLVDDLLLLARLDEHRPLQLRPIDLSELARDAVLDAQAVEPNRPFACVAPLPVMVLGDSARLRQVIDNLLRNVRVHTPGDAAASVTVCADGDAAVVAVADGGPGIDPQHLSNVFDRFWRQDSSRTRSTGGAGLGLAIASALVEAHGGTVGVENRPAGGAMFSVRVPMMASVPENS